MSTKRLRILPPQAEMLEYDEPWGAARGGQRAGKSFGFALWLFFKRIQPYPFANHCVVGSDYEQLRRGYFDLMVGLLDSFGWREGIDYTYRTAPRPRITFHRFGKVGGRVCTLQGLSTRLVERIRGMSIQTLLLEEPQTWGTKQTSGEDLYALLVGRHSHSQSSAEMYPDLVPQGRMSFNPPSTAHWLYDLCETKWKPLGWKCWRMSVEDNFLLSGREAYVAGMKVAYNQRRWASEIEGHWQTGGGNCYYGFDSDVHGYPPDGIPPVDFIDPTLPILWSLDFGVGLQCSVIAQPFAQRRYSAGWDRAIGRAPREIFKFPVPGWQHRIIRVIDEIALEDAGTPDVARAFIAWYRRNAPTAKVVLYGDPSGNQRSQNADSKSAVRTNWMTIEVALDKAGIIWDKQVPPGPPAVGDRINEVNAAFGTGDGPGMTVNLERCPVLVKDFREVMRAPNGDIIKPTGTKLTHMSDAFGYLVFWQRQAARERDVKRLRPVDRPFIGR